MTEHEGHRKRMKQRFLNHGLDNFDDHNILELLLFFAVPRQDTNALAHRLLDTFGSLERVFDVPPEELMTVSGIGENAAALIRLVPEAARRYLMEKNSFSGVLKSSHEVGNYLLPRFMNSTGEQVWILCLDGALRVLDCRCIGEGNAVSVTVDPRKVVQIALMHNAVNVVMAHNHPSGFAIPSREDHEVTKMVYDALRTVNVKLCDHIIVAGDDFVSLLDSGYFDRCMMA